MGQPTLHSEMAIRALCLALSYLSNPVELFMQMRTFSSPAVTALSPHSPSPPSFILNSSSFFFFFYKIQCSNAVVSVQKPETVLCVLGFFFPQRKFTAAEYHQDIPVEMTLFKVSFMQKR